MIYHEIYNEIIDDNKSLILFESNEYLLNIEKNDWIEIQIVNIMKIVNNYIKYKNIDKNNSIDIYFIVINDIFIDWNFLSFYINDNIWSNF